MDKQYVKDQAAGMLCIGMSGLCLYGCLRFAVYGMLYLSGIVGHKFDITLDKPNKESVSK